MSQITAKQHQQQIVAYTKEFFCYKTYAAVLKRVFEDACETSKPERLVQARAKTVSSFAETCIRKYDKYKNAVKEMTDLCGARVIVQTMEQVAAVKKFIVANFKICEEEDKGLNLSEDKFGYRDMHYIVQLKQKSCKKLGISDKDFIGREWLFSEIETWRISSNERTLLIIGDPGTGKSAVVAQLVHLNPDGQVLAYHCCQSDSLASYSIIKPPNLLGGNLLSL